MKSGRDEAARGSIPGSSPRPDREHRKPQPTTCYTVVCVKTAVEISEESQIFSLKGSNAWERPPEFREYRVHEIENGIDILFMLETAYEQEPISFLERRVQACTKLGQFDS